MTAQHTPGPRNAIFLREQIAINLQYYMQVRPGTRAAAEVIRDRQALRDELAASLRANRRAAIAKATGSAT